MILTLKMCVRLKSVTKKFIQQDSMRKNKTFHISVGFQSRMLVMFLNCYRRE